eukprot:7169-Heterococcus_DN1.PRE.1
MLVCSVCNVMLCIAAAAQQLHCERSIASEYIPQPVECSCAYAHTCSLHDCTAAVQYVTPAGCAQLLPQHADSSLLAA